MAGKTLRDISGYEGLYAVTDDGRVWSYRSDQYLKPNITKQGYERVTLKVNGAQKHLFVHDIVAYAFIPRVEGKPQVNHKDENKRNNNMDNLEWMTAKENCNYGTRNQRFHIGRDYTKLTKLNKERCNKPVLCIELGQIFESLTTAASLTGAHISKICSCCHGDRKTAGGYHWQYAGEVSA